MHLTERDNDEKKFWDEDISSLLNNIKNSS